MSVAADWHVQGGAKWKTKSKSLEKDDVFQANQLSLWAIGFFKLKEQTKKRVLGSGPRMQGFGAEIVAILRRSCGCIDIISIVQGLDVPIQRMIRLGIKCRGRTKKEKCEAKLGSLAISAKLTEPHLQFFLFEPVTE